MTDDDSKFILEYLRSLRKEIEETKARAFKILGIGIVILPGAQSFAQVYTIDALTIAIPVLVMVVALWFLSENHALMRAGRYVREVIEPSFPGVLGWEKWLESSEDRGRRSVDKFASVAFFGLFFVYFVGSVYLASERAFKLGGIVFLAVALAVYIAIGIWFLIFLRNNIQTATTTARS